ncbi:cobalamin-5'-phosphate synthase [Halogeometricum borinquense DSM 11551]|uniref:Adenosylcobinamide-GDP ribazoletransferase n=1 Tax=Halogeometricum borinquense (strain ATCC 700274 / DSM 11551 / JCM 10706 / KCTC 4070 / PR3) TaxID=469382 RepID=E4NT72_HALBP|nr:adenosylcobinamide-GDP ribazoletransferase [Halogeometricum borinquense]ADQ68169.1 cobalamin-5'-phosphate synthase [Halogeometricum borinquense DSM 11551]ELY24787.1 cobalamin-5'-phosphate synthase [Halogeometricum borinquense DSM 11551]
MVLTALRGGLVFLTRLPVGVDEASWDAFRRTPVAFPLVGYGLGALAAIPFLLPVPVPTAAALYMAALYVLTGVTHVDGLADVGDAAAVHGDAEERLAVLKDSQTGVGGALALGLALVTLGLGALSVAGTAPQVAFPLVVAAEVGAKTGMATLVCTGESAHEGLGSALIDVNDVSNLVPVAVSLVLLPALLITPVAGVAGVTTAAFAAVAAASFAPVAVAVLAGRWGNEHLGGVSGDVLGTANELGRVAGLHAGVLAWTLF